MLDDLAGVLAVRNPVLVVEGLMDKADCLVLRQQYASAIMAGRLQPRGTLVTDIDLHLVADVVHMRRCCGQPRPNLRELRDRLGVRLGQYFELGDLVPDYSAYTRLTVGGAHDLHADGYQLDGKPNHTPHRVAAAHVYLSTEGEHFTGGRLNMPRRKLQVSPRAGLLVAFESGVEDQHEVTRVTLGERDALVFWFTKDAGRRERWPDAASR